MPPVSSWREFLLQDSLSSSKVCCFQNRYLLQVVLKDLLGFVCCMVIVLLLWRVKQELHEEFSGRERHQMCAIIMFRVLSDTRLKVLFLSSHPPWRFADFGAVCAYWKGPQVGTKWKWIASLFNLYKLSGKQQNKLILDKKQVNVRMLADWGSIKPHCKTRVWCHCSS